MRVEGIQSSNIYTQQTTQISNVGQGSQEDKLQIPKSQPVKQGEKEKTGFSNERQMSEEKLKKTLEKANKSLQAFDRKFDISVHEGTNTIMVKVIDVSNDEVIREIPPEKILDIIANMQELAGILIDKRV